MWDLYDATRASYWRERGEHFCRLIDATWPQANGPGGGFACYFGGLHRWYETTLREGTPDDLLRDRLIQVGRCQADGLGRLTAPRIAQTAPDRAACDQDLPPVLGIERVLDVPVVLFAASETQDAELFDTAARACALIRRHLIRGDGSVLSGVRMVGPGRCGAPVARAAFREDSTHACGQAWATLGFATAGRLMGFEPWLQTARQAAQFMVERLSGDPVPPWDFDAPGDASPERDSAAAAVAATALLELADAEQTVGPEQARDRRRLQEIALRTLAALCGPEYLAAVDSPEDGILRHGIGNRPAGWAVDQPVIWGDAFLVRSLCRAIRLLTHS